MVLETWHLTPEYINEHWTDELLAVMVRARGDRLRRFSSENYNPNKNTTPSEPNVVSDVALFKKMGIKVIKR